MGTRVLRAWVAVFVLAAGCTSASGAGRALPDGAPLTAPQYVGAREAACWDFADTIVGYAGLAAVLDERPPAEQRQVLQAMADAYRDFRQASWELVPPPQVADDHVEMDRLLGQMVDLLDAAAAATSDHDPARAAVPDRFPDLVAAYDGPARRAGIGGECGW